MFPFLEFLIPLKGAVIVEKISLYEAPTKKYLCVSQKFRHKFCDFR